MTMVNSVLKWLSAKEDYNPAQSSHKKIIECEISHNYNLKNLNNFHSLSCGSRERGTASSGCKFVNKCSKKVQILPKCNPFSAGTDFGLQNLTFIVKTDRTRLLHKITWLGDPR